MYSIEDTPSSEDGNASYDDGLLTKTETGINLAREIKPTERYMRDIDTEIAKFTKEFEILCQKLTPILIGEIGLSDNTVNGEERVAQSQMADILEVKLNCLRDLRFRISSLVKNIDL